MKLTDLFATLVWHRHNMQMIHWNAIGCHFENIHSICDEYAAEITKNIDKVAEFIKMIDLKEPIPTLPDVIKIMTEDDKKHPMVGFEQIESKDARKMIIIIFQDLMEQFKDARDDLPDDIQSEIDSMIYYYRTEGMYKCKASLEDSKSSVTITDDIEDETKYPEDIHDDFDEESIEDHIEEEYDDD